MHRSGSSLFAQWLHHNQVFIGHDLLEEASTNKYGHFEDMDFLNLHAAELMSSGLHRSGLYGDLSSLTLSDDFADAARKVVSDRSHLDVWAWKEPRTTLFLESWKEAIPALKVIILERPKAKVVDSLYQRFKKHKWYVTRNPLKSLAWFVDIDLRPGKWTRKFGEVCDHYENCWKVIQQKHPDDLIVISLDDFLNNHAQVVHDLNQFLGLQLPDDALAEVFDSGILH